MHSIPDNIIDEEADYKRDFKFSELDSCRKYWGVYRDLLLPGTPAQNILHVPVHLWVNILLYRNIKLMSVNENVFVFILS